MDGLEQLPLLGRGGLGLQAQPRAAGAAWSIQQCSVTAGVHPATDVSAVTKCSLLVMLLTSRQWQWVSPRVFTMLSEALAISSRNLTEAFLSAVLSVPHRVCFPF